MSVGKSLIYLIHFAGQVMEVRGSDLLKVTKQVSAYARSIPTRTQVLEAHSQNV